jgi:hypothetical protein
MATLGTRDAYTLQRSAADTQRIQMPARVCHLAQADAQQPTHCVHRTGTCLLCASVTGLG